MGIVLFVALEPASGQVVTGVLTNRGSDSPVPGAFVLLLDRTDREIVRTATDEEGRFTLRAPAPGEYLLQAERIAWDATPSRSFDLDRDQTRRVDYEATMTPIHLIDLPAGEAGCRMDETPRARVAWGEARKALHAIAWTIGARDYRYRARTFERDLGLDGREVRRESDSVIGGLDQVPYAALDPDALAEEGYVRTGANGSTTYFIPDAAALLDDRFGDTHCFSLSDATPLGLLGLSFTPIPDRTFPDIGGTVWLDAATLGLARIDFLYQNDPSDTGSHPARGTIDFRRIQGPDWMVRGWREVGAAAVEVVDAQQRQLFSDPEFSVLSGAVYDSTAGGPLIDGIVALAGTKYWTTTDGAGRFMVAGHLDGDYSVVFGSRRLDSLGFVSLPRKVSLERGRESALDLVVPSVGTIIGRRCGDLVAGPNRRVLVGVVKDAASNAPVANAVVTVFREMIPENLQHLVRSDLQGTAFSDSLGVYTLCGVPTGEKIVILASGLDRTSDFVAVTFLEDGVEFDERRVENSGHPVARLDLELKSSEDRGNQLSGVVTNQATQAPIDGAMVQIDGTAFVTRTDLTGAFLLTGVPSGRFRLLVRQFGYRMLRHDVEMSDHTALSLSSGTLALIPGDTAIVLDPIFIEAEGVAPELADFERRRSTGIGSFVTREEFEKWSPIHATDVLRRMRGLRVRPNPRYGSGRDRRRFLIEPSRDVGQRITRIITTEAERAATSFGGTTQTVVNECPVLLFMDGVFLGDTFTNDVDNIISATDLTAVEVYSPSQVPARFALPGSTCGVAVFWTR